MATATEAPRGTGNGRLTEEELFRALPARSANREIRVGIFVIVGLLAFFAALFTFTDVGTFRGRYYAHTVVQDAGGMRRGDPVQMRGVNIGRVVGFDMVPGGVQVRLELYNEYEVPQGSQVLVKSSGLLGGMVVDVVPGASGERIEDGATLPGMAETGIMSAAGGLAVEADSVLTRASALLSRETVGAVGTSAQELQALLAELNALAALQRAGQRGQLLALLRGQRVQLGEQQREELAALSGSLQRSAQGVEAATTGGELERAAQNIDRLTARLDETTVTLGRASGSLEAVLGRLERGEGTLGRLTTDDELYVNLNAAVAGLNQLVADIRANPRRYLSVSVF